MKTIKSCIFIFLMWCALFATALTWGQSPEMRNSGSVKIGWKL